MQVVRNIAVRNIIFRIKPTRIATIRFTIQRKKHALGGMTCMFPDDYYKRKGNKVQQNI